MRARQFTAKPTSLKFAIEVGVLKDSNTMFYQTFQLKVRLWFGVGYPTAAFKYYIYFFQNAFLLHSSLIP